MVVAAGILGLASGAQGAIQVKIEDFVRGACGEEGKEIVTIRADGNQVIIRNQANYTCCYLPDARLKIRGGRIEVRERNAGEVCRCICPIEMTYTISRIFPGEYEVVLYREDGTVLGREIVVVEPIVTQVEVAPCGEPPPGIPSIRIGMNLGEMFRDAILIDQRNILANTCLELVADVSLEGKTVTVRQKDVGIPCKCQSYFDLSIEIPGLPRGIYQVDLFDLGGELVQSSEVIIELPQVIATMFGGMFLAVEPIYPQATVFRNEETSIIVEQWFTRANCCLDYQAEVNIEEDPVSTDTVVVHMRQLDLGEPCDCIGTFNLRIEALDFDPATYLVILYSLQDRFSTVPPTPIAKADVTVGEPHFIRGAVTEGDTSINLADVLAILRHLFVPGQGSACADTADPDDTGRISLRDAIYLLRFIFGQGPPPELPYPFPGPDPSPDRLGCLRPPCAPEKFIFMREIQKAWDFVEFCIPAGEPYETEVLEIYPEVLVMPGVSGRIGCTEEESLCIIEWPDMVWSKLCALSLLDYVTEIRGSHWE